VVVPRFLILNFGLVKNDKIVRSKITEAKERIAKNSNP
jgi:hypothetical protein